MKFPLEKQNNKRKIKNNERLSNKEKKKKKNKNPVIEGVKEQRFPTST